MVKQTTINSLLLFVPHLNVSADVLSEETKVMSGKKLSQKQTNENFWKYFFSFFKVSFLSRGVSVILHLSYVFPNFMSLYEQQKFPPQRWSNKGELHDFGHYVV